MFASFALFSAIVFLASGKFNQLLGTAAHCTELKESPHSDLIQMRSF